MSAYPENWGVRLNDWQHIPPEADQLPNAILIEWAFINECDQYKPTYRVSQEIVKQIRYIALLWLRSSKSEKTYSAAAWHLATLPVFKSQLYRIGRCVAWRDAGYNGAFLLPNGPIVYVNE